MTSIMLSLIKGKRPARSPIAQIPLPRPGHLEGTSHPYGSDSRLRESLKRSLGLYELVAFIKEPTPEHEAELRTKRERSRSLQEIIPNPDDISAEFESRKRLSSLVLDNLKNSFIENPSYLALGDLYEECHHALKGVKK